MKDIILLDTALNQICEPCFSVDGDINSKDLREEITSIVNDIKEVLTNTEGLEALSAPQIGINKRIFCMKFDTGIKTFINPIVRRRSEEKFINKETYVDGKSVAFVARPKEIEVTYLTDEFKPEDNKLLSYAAAIFTQQYNLLDGITVGAMHKLTEVTNETLPMLIEAIYSGSGIVLDANEELPAFEELQPALATFSTIYNAKLEEIVSSEEDSDLKKVARYLWHQESIILGRTKIVDEDGWKAEKHYKQQLAKSAQEQRKASFRSFAGKRCK